jgi:hypothetical protein
MTKGKNNGAKNQRTRDEAPQGPSNALVPTVAQKLAVVRLSTAKSGTKRTRTVLN